MATGDIIHSIATIMQWNFDSYMLIYFSSQIYHCFATKMNLIERCLIPFLHDMKFMNNLSLIFEHILAISSAAEITSSSLW